jgi:hypothetical protein
MSPTIKYQELAYKCKEVMIMGLAKKATTSFVLLIALILPISASGDMSGAGTDSGGFPPGETSGMIIVETSGEYSGGFSPWSQTTPTNSFTSGYQSPTSRGVTLGSNSPLLLPTSSGKPTDPDSVTSDILSGINGLSQDLRDKYSEYNKGTLTREKFVEYCTNLDWNLKNIKAALQTLQGLTTDASQSAEAANQAEKLYQENPYTPGSRLEPVRTGAPSSSDIPSGSNSNANTQSPPGELGIGNANSNSGASGAGTYN